MYADIDIIHMMNSLPLDPIDLFFFFVFFFFCAYCNIFLGREKGNIDASWGGAWVRG